MEKINKNKLGLVIGIFLAIFHLIWVIAVAAGIAKPFLDWVLSLHLITLSYSLLSFSFASAGLLLVIAFVAGYVWGWIFAAVWNWFANPGKKRK